MTTDTTSEQRSFPYVGATGWLTRLHELFQRNLRLVGDPYQQAMKELLDRWYPDLLGQIEASEVTTPEGVENFFVTATTMGRSGRQQITAVFRWLLREAGLEARDRQIWVEGRRKQPREAAARTRRNGAQAEGAARRSAKKRSEGRGAPQDEVTATRAVAQSEQDNPAGQRLATISSVLKINIDGTWDEERMKAAFRWLDQLLKGDSFGD